MMKWNYANSITYNPILALVKASFLLTLIKLRPQNKWMNGSLWVTLVFNACFAVGAPIACILQCNPISKYWDHNVQGKCVDAGAYTVSTSSIVLTTDVLVLLMPS
jgi:nitric oxide reductase large subunit